MIEPMKQIKNKAPSKPLPIIGRKPSEPFFEVPNMPNKGPLLDVD
jgi:hypothetical protein